MVYIQNQIVEGLKGRILSSYPDLVDTLTSNVIRSHFTLFINCLVENPRFDSQVRFLPLCAAVCILSHSVIIARQKKY